MPVVINVLLFYCFNVLMFLMIFFILVFQVTSIYLIMSSFDLTGLMDCLPSFGIIVLIAMIVYKLFLAPGKVLSKPANKALEATNKAIDQINKAVADLSPGSGSGSSETFGQACNPDVQCANMADGCSAGGTVCSTSAFTEQFTENFAQDTPSGCPSVRNLIFTGKPLIENGTGSNPEHGGYMGMDSVTAPWAPTHNMEIASFANEAVSNEIAERIVNDASRQTIVSPKPATQNWSIRPDIIVPFQGYLKGDDYTNAPRVNIEAGGNM